MQEQHQYILPVPPDFGKAHFRVGTHSYTMIKVVSRSSMVSVFEKPKFRDYGNSLPIHEKEQLASGLKMVLHGKEQKGFELMLALLGLGKLAKWPLMTINQTYFRPHHEAFVKPTTAKGIIDYFELEDLQYKPAPTWDFYEKFRAVINDMKSKVDPSLSLYNAAFSGFLMMTLEMR